MHINLVLTLIAGCMFLVCFACLLYSVFGRIAMYRRLLIILNICTSLLELVFLARGLGLW